jgi:hypothetical protein
MCVCMSDAGSCRQKMYKFMNEAEGILPGWMVEHAFSLPAVWCRGCILEMYFTDPEMCELCDIEHRQVIAASDDIEFKSCSVETPCRFRRFFKLVYTLNDDQYNSHLALIRAAVSNQQLNDPHYAQRLPIQPSDVDAAIERVSTARAYVRGGMTCEEWEKCRRIPDMLLISDAPNYPFAIHQLTDLQYRVDQGECDDDDDLFEADLAKLEHECIEITEFGSGPSNPTVAYKAWASIKQSVRCRRDQRRSAIARFNKT